MRRSKVPLGPHFFVMANENSNQTKTHKKHKGFQRGMEPGVGFTEAGGPGVLGAQICSVLIWGAGSGGLEPLGLGGVEWGPLWAPLLS